MTSADICEALDRRYGQSSNGMKAEQWIALREARSGAGFDGNNGQCDYLAINTWQSKGLQLIGHEIKVSASDWKRELEHPEKSEQFARFCRRWWVVMPSDLAKKAKPEIPPAWGLLSVSEAGRVTEIIQAPSKEPAPVPVWWWVGWLAQLDRVEKRKGRSEVDRAVNEAVTKARDQWEKSHKDRTAARNEKLEENARLFREATGSDLAHVWKHNMDKLGVLWQLAGSGFDLEALANQLRQASDNLKRAASLKEKTP